jgi:hypothetical protein
MLLAQLLGEHLTGQMARMQTAGVPVFRQLTKNMT